MSINLRTAVAWLLIAALMAAYCPTVLAAGHGGGGGGGGFHGGGGGGYHGGGGGGSFHGGGGGFHSSGFSGFHSSGNFAGHTGFSSGNISHNWSMNTPHVASRIVPNQFHGQSFTGHGQNWAAGSINHGAVNHGGFNNGAFNHGAFNHGDFHHGFADFHHGFGDFHHGHGFNDWWRFGFLGPFFSVGWWPGYYDYGYGGWPYGDYYDRYNYNVAPYAVASSDYFDTDVPLQTPPMLQANNEDTNIDSEESEFYSQAIEAFQQGEYSAAARLAAHAALDEPRNPNVHLLLSLGLFAVGQYRGAAMEAHAVAALGAVPDWPKLLGLYDNNVESYTEHLRALEQYVRNNPTAPDGRFLLGFQYMMDGHRSVAQDQFLESLRLMPRDSLAAKLLTQEGGTIPPDIARELEASRHQPPPSGMGTTTTK
jgi:hypothetical protein